MIDGGEDQPVTHDSLLRGRVRLVQPARGFRSSLDPVLLAGFVRPPYGRFVDIGCGTGALSFLLLARDAAATGVGVEIQPRLARLAARGAEANGLGARFASHAGDALAHAELRGGAFDLVVTNPPYRPLGEGVLPADRERAIANHEIALTLAGWLDLAAAALRPGGRVAAIYPPDRLDEMRAGLAARDLGLRRLRFVRAHVGEPISRVLIEAGRGGGAGLAIEPALVVHQGGGFSAEMRRMLGDE